MNIYITYTHTHYAVILAFVVAVVLTLFTSVTKQTSNWITTIIVLI